MHPLSESKCWFRQCKHHNLATADNIDSINCTKYTTITSCVRHDERDKAANKVTLAVTCPTIYFNLPQGVNKLNKHRASDAANRRHTENRREKEAKRKELMLKLQEIERELEVTNEN